jgi:amino acid transporter
MVTMFGVSVDSKGIEDFGTTLTHHPWNMLIGFVEVALLAVIMILGTRLMMRVQLWLFSFGMLGLLAAAIALIVTSHAAFINHYNDYAEPFTGKADTYHYFIRQAQASGTDLGGGTNWHNTIIASGAFIAFGVWTWFSTNLAGEIRQAGTRKNWYSMLGGLSITFGTILIMVVLLYHTVGREFLTSVNAVAGDPKVYTLPNAPWWNTLVSAIWTSPVFVLLLGLTFICWAPLIVYIQIVQPVRALFAWAFDQVIPEKAASINERTHTPALLLAIIAIASIPFLYLAAYSSSFFKYVALSTIVGFPTFILVGIGAMLFPYRKRGTYEASVSNIKVLGVPVMVLFGIGSIVAGAFGAFLWLKYPSLGLPGAGKKWTEQLFTSPGEGGLALIATCLIAGAVIYYIGKAWRRSQGIDLSLNYMEIPPE